MVVATQICPDAFYDEHGVSKILAIPIERIREECNRKRLKCTKRAGNRFFRGQWIIAWLEGDEANGDEVASV